MEKERTSGSVWVLAELDDCRLHAVSTQLVGKARSLADQLNVPVEAILLGEQPEDPAADLIAAGADRVYIGASPSLALYQADIYADIIIKLVQIKQPDILLIGSTFMGRELAPILAARLQTGLTAHCIDLVLDENNLLDQQIPAYGGLLSILCPEKRPQMATVAVGVFPAPVLDPTRAGEIERLAIPAELFARTWTLEVVHGAEDQQSLESAAFIVAGGAGAGTPDGWNQIRELAETLNAALACTRPAVDEGWAELETMVGQSGKMVAPQFYLGVGLSGELQHMVGIKGAQIMAAINNDSKSPVFAQVDYGVVEDCRTFVPLLIEKIKAIQDERLTC
jgi:electron transfer flavoprotein alpha subunit